MASPTASGTDGPMKGKGTAENHHGILMLPLDSRAMCRNNLGSRNVFGFRMTALPHYRGGGGNPLNWHAPTPNQVV